MEVVIETTNTAEILAQLPPAVIGEACRDTLRSCSETGSWWVVIFQEGTDVHAGPSWMTQRLAPAKYLEVVRCLGREGAWLHLADSELQPRGWAMWKKCRKRQWELVLKPVGLLKVQSQWLDDDGRAPVQLPGEALDWSLQEVDVFLGTMGAQGPSRESAIGRSDRQLVRAVRYGPNPLEYRVSAKEGGGGGVFSLTEIKAGRLIERCPLLRITEAAGKLSAVLNGLAIRLPPEGEKERWALPLGFARLYSSRTNLNCRWGHVGEEDIAIWASRDIFVGDELALELDGMPLAPPSIVQQEAARSLEDELSLKHKASLPSGKLAKAGGLAHGRSSAHGRGVFARRDYEAGELLESCPVLRLDEVGAKALVSYRWGVPDRPDFFFPLGLGALYNHLDTPHARGRLDLARQVLEIWAEAKIETGQEVLVSYGDSYFDDDFAQLGHSRAAYKAPAAGPTV